MAGVLRRWPQCGLLRAGHQKVEDLLVPAITLTEVFKRICQQRGESAALQAVAQMQQGRVIALDAAMALTAARLGIDEHLPLADSAVYAAARHAGADLWTQDGDFEGKPSVKYRAQRPDR